MNGRWLELEQLPDPVDYLSSLASPAVSDEQTIVADLVDHGEELEGPPIHLLDKLEDDRPDVVWILSS